MNCSMRMHEMNLITRLYDHSTPRSYIFLKAFALHPKRARLSWIIIIHDPSNAVPPKKIKINNTYFQLPVVQAPNAVGFSGVKIRMCLFLTQMPHGTWNICPLIILQSFSQKGANFSCSWNDWKLWHGMTTSWIDRAWWRFQIYYPPVN